MTGNKQFTLPDLTKIVPFQWSSNPHYPRASAESSAWINGFNLLNEDKVVEHKVDMLELLASYAFPYTGFEELRTCCDLVYMITSLDDFSDTHSTDTFIVAISGKPPPPGKATNLYSMVTQFRERLSHKATANCMRRFVEYCEKYCSAVAKEAELRERGCILNIESYTKLRRENSAAELCFGVIEYVEGIGLPDAVFENDVFQLVYWTGADMLRLTNDLYSFNREQSKGVALNNIFTIVMKEKGYTLQEAADYIGEEHRRLVAQFKEASARMPSFGAEVDEDVRKYIFSVEQWVIGNIIWCLETPRYYGTWSPPLQRERLIKVWDVED